MTIARLSSKDPDDVDFFSFDFGPRLLADEVLLSDTVVVDAGDGALTVLSFSSSGVFVTASLGNGALGTDYTVRCRVTTSLGRILDLSFHLFIEQD